MVAPAASSGRANGVRPAAPAYTRSRVRDRPGPASHACAVITVSDTCTPETDTSGQFIVQRLTAADHVIHQYAVVKDEAAEIVALVHELVRSACTVIILNGGTGIAKRDSTFEAIDVLLHKRLLGFGELFRMLSFEAIGPGAMLSRATAGVINDTLLFSLPGSTNAGELAMDRLILPELRHLVWETMRK